MSKRVSVRLRQSQSVLLGLTTVALTVLLAGCGMGTAANGPVTVNAMYSGHVFGGQPPVAGATVAVYVATETGYNASFAPATATTTTSANGSFSITGTFNCPDTTSQAYLVATGGNPGLSGTVDNSALFLVAALGPCSAASSTTVDINEVTTVAAAYALSGFAPAGGSGMIEANVATGTSMAGISTKSTNKQGIVDAFSNANNIVNFTTGTAYATTPGSTTTAVGTVPQATINTLADILEDCVNSTGPSSTPCANLFSAATPPTGSGISAPVNSWQAALDIATYPGNGAKVNTLFGLLSANAAFVPVLSAAPNDWTLGISYTSVPTATGTTSLISGTGMNIDANDNVYVTGAGYLLKFSSVGVPQNNQANLLANTAVTSTDTLRQIAFDKSGNLFLSDGAQTGVYEYTPSTSALALLSYAGSPASDPNANTYAIAVDQYNDPWTSSYSKSSCATAATECLLTEFVKGASTAYSPANSFSTFTAPQPTGGLGGARGVAFDVLTGNVWYTSIDDNVAGLMTVTPSATATATATGNAKTLTGFGSEVSTPATNTGYGTIAVAVDSTSRAWFVVAGGAASTKSGSTTSAVPGGLYSVSSAGTVNTTNVLGSVTGVLAAAVDIVDGNNNVFVANGGSSLGTSSVLEYSPGFNSNAGAVLSPNFGFNPNSVYASSTNTVSGGTLYEPAYIAVDRAGALWALSSGSGGTKPANLIQILGVAAPTDTTLANGNYGVKP